MQRLFSLFISFTILGLLTQPFVFAQTATDADAGTRNQKLFLPLINNGAVSNADKQAMENPLAESDNDQTATAAASATWKLVFSDDFNGTSLNNTIWRTCYNWFAYTPNGCPGLYDGNGELEWYQASNVQVAGGLLHLRGERRHVDDPTWGSHDYVSGMIASHPDAAHRGFSFLYGRWEAVAKLPRGVGLWPAFWGLATRKNWPPEIDVMENVVNPASHWDTHSILMTNHYHDANGVYGSASKQYTAPYDFADGFHRFRVDWEPGLLVWYVDNVEQFRTTNYVPDAPFYMIANLAIGGVWPGSPDNTTPFPVEYQIDSIKVWQREQIGNLVANPEFDRSTNNWILHLRNAANATFATTTKAKLSGSSAAQIQIQNNGGPEWWNVQFDQPFPVYKGHTYQLSFMGKTTVAHPVEVVIQKDGDPYTVYWSSGFFNLTTSAKTYNFTISTASVPDWLDETDVYLRFNIGGKASTVYLDKIRVAEQ